MSKIVIDLNKWQTITQYAAENNVPQNTISMRIQRKRKGEKSGLCPEFRDINALGITLVKKKYFRK